MDSWAGSFTVNMWLHSFLKVEQRCHVASNEEWLTCVCNNTPYHIAYCPTQHQNSTQWERYSSKETTWCYFTFHCCRFLQHFNRCLWCSTVGGNIRCCCSPKQVIRLLNVRTVTGRSCSFKYSLAKDRVVENQSLNSWFVVK